MSKPLTEAEERQILAEVIRSPSTSYRGSMARLQAIRMLRELDAEDDEPDAFDALDDEVTAARRRRSRS